MIQRRGITGDILLEAGTNELEVLVFRLGNQGFGVNVAKVREVLQPMDIIDVPHKHPSVVGLINVRDQTLALIDLRQHLRVGMPDDVQDHDRTVIITEFNGVRIGFLVDSVERIHRLSWATVLPMPKVSFSAGDHGEMVSSTTGAVDLDGRLILLVDFESVADSVLMEQKFAVTNVENKLNIERGSKRIVLAEDSPFMRTQMKRILHTSGYTGAEVYPDGQAAWEAINKLGAPIDAVVSDIEMPRMDGLYLTKRIKESPEHSHIPVVLFSSLISEDNANKGQQVGATVQIPKPELPEMVHLIDRIVSGEITDGAQLGAIAAQEPLAA